MAFPNLNLRVFALAALAIPAAAQPAVTREIPPVVHWPVDEWLTVTVEAKGNGSLAYQWYKGPAELMKRSDKSPLRLAGQDSDTLAMACPANGAGDYWVEVTDTADHRTVLEGPMRLVPCFRLDAKGQPASLFAGGGNRLKPVAEHQEQERRKELDRQAASARAALPGPLALLHGGVLPTGPAAKAKAPAPAGAWTESKAQAVFEMTPMPVPAQFNDLPDLVDAPEDWYPH